MADPIPVGPVRVGSNVMASKLVTRTRPVYPPLLVQAAMDSVKTWVDQPTLLNGNPVEVITTIDVNFALAE
jgi:hypothetical protein